MKPLLNLSVLVLCAVPALWLMGKALPLIAPFLVSMAFAAVMEPGVSALCRRGMKRGMASGLLTVLVLGITLAVLSICTAGGAHLLTSYAKKAPALLTALTDTADALTHSLTRLLSAVPPRASEQLWDMAEGVTRQLSELPMRASERLLEGVTAFAKASPDWLLFACTAVIGIYFFSLYFRDMGAFFRRQLPTPVREKLALVRKVLREAAGGWLKVQCILSGVTFLILYAAFWIMGISDRLPAAAAIAIIDALPILGAGAVLIPWALIAMLMGRVGRAMGVAAVYGVLLVTHNLLQAKLMGTHLGLHPVTALVSLYAGWKLAGITGMLLLPIACVVLQSLNEAKVIRLYR